MAKNICRWCSALEKEWVKWLLSPAGGRLTVSLENGAVCGGFGESAGADLKFGWPDAVVCHGSVDELEIEHGFDAESVAKTILRRIAKN